MRLTEALRLGTMLGHKSVLTIWLKMVPLGAAIRALGLTPQFGYAEFRRLFPRLHQSLVEAGGKP
jgi:hypothetical protein